MSLSRIPKDKREQGASASLKLLQERRDWETKIVKTGGEYKYVQFVFYNITSRRHEFEQFVYFIFSVYTNNRHPEK